MYSNKASSSSSNSSNIINNNNNMDDEEQNESLDYHLSNLPLEIQTMIFRNLNIQDQDNLGSTCKVLQEAGIINHNSTSFWRTNFKTLSNVEIIDACRRNIVAAYIFFKEGFVKKNRLSDVLEIASSHEALALSILADKKYFLKEGDALVVLAKNHLSVANVLLTDTMLFEKLGLNNLTQLANYHPELSKSIFEKALIDGKPVFQEYAFRQDDEMIQKILGDKKTLAALTRYDLIQLGEHHFEIADKIIKTPALRGKLSQVCIARLGKAHIKIALKIFEDKELLKTFSESNLFIMCNHLPIAQILFKERGVKARYDSSNYGAFSLCAHLSIADDVFKYLDSSGGLTESNMLFLAMRHPPIARKIIKNKELSDKLSGFTLSKLGKHVENAQRILKDKAFSIKLSGGDLFEMACTGRYDLPSMKSSAIDHLLFEIERKDNGIAKQIINQPEFYDKLSDIQKFGVMSVVNFDLSMKLFGHAHIVGDTTHRTLLKEIGYISGISEIISNNFEVNLADGLVQSKNKEVAQSKEEEVGVSSPPKKRRKLN